MRKTLGLTLASLLIATSAFAAVPQNGANNGHNQESSDGSAGGDTGSKGGRSGSGR